MYRATRDGDLPRDFHAKCDNYSPTITIIKTSGGCVIGGFTSQKWNPSLAYASDPSAFIFSLNKKKKYLQNNFNNSVYCAPNCCATFGGGHDIHLASGFLSNLSSYSNTPYSYQVTPSLGLTNGEKNFRATEVEVYLVEFI